MVAPSLLDRFDRRLSLHRVGDIVIVAAERPYPAPAGA
jgi:hypothetical protein